VSKRVAAAAAASALALEPMMATTYHSGGNIQ
jgi:hypothetical protein